MLQVQHLVVDDVFENITRHARMIEDTADHDGVMGGFVVAKNPPRFVLAPTHPRTSHEPVKEPRVEVFEDGIEIIKMTTWRAQEFAATHLPDEMRFANDFVAGNVFPV